MGVNGIAPEPLGFQGLIDGIYSKNIGFQIQ